MPPNSSPADPYPRITGEVMDVRHPDPLVLVRMPEAPRLRTGADAHYIVGAPYRVAYRLRGEVRWRAVTVPEGMLTDLASVPRLACGLVGRVGSHLEAAIVHDYLYLAWQDRPDGTARAQDGRFADDLMWAAMRRGRVGRLKAWTIYAAVRLFGGWAYRDPQRIRYAADVAGTTAKVAR